MEVEKYEHHGKTVSVMAELKGKHRQHCLFFAGCRKFFPGSPNNCRIAKATFDNCVKFGVTTPMYECSEYEK